ncbi:hypothetical protein PABG_11562 [Paracoccidioides brasiliensis Pb03]|uniref:Uncharacterized protein n=1 Tax=Paracoccidioides brasiliensis TaxID=121759 RepID=A0A1D2JI44_PARBR|nr:hypothetical protein PABG_11562 [Paracoccidioides brasiliensis Pb03]ODH37340.1 hypothetical protein ACO22_02615 [Paracoccidioides brasiliensis]
MLGEIEVMEKGGISIGRYSDLVFSSGNPGTAIANGPERLCLHNVFDQRLQQLIALKILK